MSIASKASADLNVPFVFLLVVQEQIAWSQMLAQTALSLDFHVISKFPSSQVSDLKVGNPQEGTLCLSSK